MSVELFTPILKGGVENTHFFNGRLLTAEDLQTQQKADLRQRRQLGRAIGEGVIQGMAVSVGETGTGGILPTVAITKGFALNRGGQVIELPQDVQLNLVREPLLHRTGSGVFETCKSLDPTLIPTGTGVYILVAAPGSGYKGKAPMHYMEDSGRISGCDHKYEVFGVQFKLVYLDITNLTLAGGDIGDKIRDCVHDTGTAGRSKLRNLLAHLCLGTETAAGFSTHLFQAAGSSAAEAEYGPLDVLRKENCLKNSDVPLALILWTHKGLEFADMWPVRRKVHSPFILENTPYPKTDRRSAELEAAHLQFQDHLQSLFRTISGKKKLPAIKAVDYFHYLPAVGMVPVYDNEANKEHNQIKFFEDLTIRAPVFMEGVKLRDLLGTSFTYEPIELKKGTSNIDNSKNNELIWLYRDRQNMQFIDDYPAKAGQAYIVFSSGYIPFRGEAQYNLSRYDYSNYGPGVADKFKK